MRFGQNTVHRGNSSSLRAVVPSPRKHPPRGQVENRVTAQEDIGALGRIARRLCANLNQVLSSG